jgi:predicted DNA-binding transcriptional regulator AlpA
MLAVSLREKTVPRFAMRREEAAASMGISPSTWDKWVSDGIMPAGRKVGGIVLWHPDRVRDARDRLFEDPEPAMPEAEWGDDPA